jgi:transposase
MAALATLSPKTTRGESVITDQQVRLLMKLLSEDKPLIQAAVRAGMSEPTARKYARSGQMPSEVTPPRTWRTRPDPYEEVWPEIDALLKKDGGLEAKTIFKELQERYPGRFPPGQLRTLQRRVHAWRTQSGPPKEVFFEQVHPPGRQGQSDFTDMGELGITIAGEPFQHLLYHFVLTYSNWEAVMTCPSESFESLTAGLQGALWRLGGVPAEHRTDNLSAATHELHDSRGRDFTKRYRKVLDHYNLKGTCNFPGNANENGDVESSNGHLKSAIDQRLRLRGSRDFASRSAYEAFLHECVASRNATREERLAEERLHLHGLPGQALPSYTELFASVSRHSVIRVGKRRYMVPSRLIRCKLTVHLHADILELFYQGVQVGVLPRLLGEEKAHIDYRQIIHSLVRKPGAFRHYAFREGLYPRLEFRRAYDALVAHDDARADFEYVRILHLAAQDGEQAVESVLEGLRTEAVVPQYETVRERVRGPRTPGGAPDVQIDVPDLSRYDRLLGSYAAAADGEEAP